MSHYLKTCWESWHSALCKINFSNEGDIIILTTGRGHKKPKSKQRKLFAKLRHIVLSWYSGEEEGRIFTSKWLHVDNGSVVTDSFNSSCFLKKKKLILGMCYHCCPNEYVYLLLASYAARTNHHAVIFSVLVI